MAMACPAGNEARATTPIAIYKIGTAAALGDFSVTLDNVAIGSGSEKSAHGAILSIQYTVQNISPAAVALARFPLMQLQDRSGGLYEVISGGQTHPARILAPGQKVTGSARFQIPPDAADPLGWLLRLGGEQGPRITLR